VLNPVFPSYGVTFTFPARLIKLCVRSLLMADEQGPSTPLGPLVLDTSAILSGKRLDTSVQLYAPETVLEEFEREDRDRRALDYLRDAGLRIRDPSEGARSDVLDVAHETGDDARLSAADRDVLALALDVDGGVATDDYSIQNVAEVLGVVYQGVSQDGIDEVWEWVEQCTACGRTVEEDVDVCPVCGGGLETVRSD
jgi:UPF0271 protein